MEVFIIVTVLWIFSVCLHEFGHALVAYWGGDHTVKDKGYLTMNPLHYTHPLVSIVLPVVFMMMGGIGLPGGAVYIERHLLRSKWWDTAVSLAGPATNLILIVMIGSAFRFGLLPNNPESLTSVSLGFLLLLQISAFVLNLLPFPPLDGYQAIAPWLPEHMRRQLDSVAGYGLWIVFGALWLIKPLNFVFWGFVFLIYVLMGADVDLIGTGWKAFRFWEHSS